MPEAVVRALVLLVAAGLAVGLGVAAKRMRRSAQPAADVSAVTTDAALIAFTSTECSNCAKVMVLLGGLAVVVREIAYEREPALFETSGVEAVPLTVVLRRDGTFAKQFAGKVRRRAVRRALAQAGW